MFTETSSFVTFLKEAFFVVYTSAQPYSELTVVSTQTGVSVRKDQGHGNMTSWLASQNTHTHTLTHLVVVPQCLDLILTKF